MKGTTIWGLGSFCALLCVGAQAQESTAAASGTTSFIGMWMTGSASRITNCLGTALTNDAFGTTLTWSAGASGHIQTPLVGKCVLDAKVTGNIALAPDQICNDNGLTYTVGGTFTLQPDGSARLAEHALVIGKGLNCSGTVNGTYKTLVP